MDGAARLPTIADVERAAERLAGFAVRTPLLATPQLDGRPPVLVKCENLQRTGSFKFRGAYNAMAALGGAARSQGVVAMSSGNHAQGVAEAARCFGIAATVVMPADAPAVKRARTERSGARVVTYERAREDRDAVAARVIAEEGGVLIHPFDDPQVIAGQGTIGLEIAAELEATARRPDAVVIPCGGGGLSAGIGLAVRSRFPETEIVLVEPAGFDDYGRSLSEGRLVRCEAAAASVCDALLAPAPGRIGFSLNRRNQARAVTVTDAQALSAVAWAFQELKLVVEPGGAVALAAVLHGLVERVGTVVVVLSGGNIDPAVMARSLAAGAGPA